MHPGLNPMTLFVAHEHGGVAIVIGPLRSDAHPNGLPEPEVGFIESSTLAPIAICDGGQDLSIFRYYALANRISYDMNQFLHANGRSHGSRGRGDHQVPAGMLGLRHDCSLPHVNHLCDDEIRVVAAVHADQGLGYNGTHHTHSRHVSSESGFQPRQGILVEHEPLHNEVVVLGDGLLLRLREFAKVVIPVRKQRVEIERGGDPACRLWPVQGGVGPCRNERL